MKNSWAEPKFLRRVSQIMRLEGTERETTANKLTPPAGKNKGQATFSARACLLLSQHTH
jgi:hypothetical protein